MTAEFFNDLILKYKKENDAQNFISELGANYVLTYIKSIKYY